MYAVKNHDPEAVEQRLHSLKQPTLLLWGQMDRWRPVERAARWGELVGQLSTVTVKNAGHLLHEERPDRVLAALTPVLAKAAKEGPPAPFEATLVMPAPAPSRPADEPGEGQEAPEDQQAAPANEEFVPVDGEAAPANEEFVPVNGEAAPANEEFAPMDGEAAPANEEFAPMDGEAVPNDDGSGGGV